MSDSVVDAGSDKISPVREKAWARIKRLEEQENNRGSQFPPFNIQPFRHPRSRLSTPMSDEDRALRKQWLDDQVLAPDEPIEANLPYNIERNIFRRISNFTLDKSFEPFVRKNPELRGLRNFTGGIVLAWFTGCLLWYHVKYNPTDWTRYYGIRTYQSHRVNLYNVDKEPKMECNDFRDFGFKKRTALHSQE